MTHTMDHDDPREIRAQRLASERYHASRWWAMGRADGGADDARFDDAQPFADRCRAEALAYYREETSFLASLFDQWRDYVSERAG